MSTINVKLKGNTDIKFESIFCNLCGQPTEELDACFPNHTQEFLCSGCNVRYGINQRRENIRIKTVNLDKGMFQHL
jgi:hypothetical protein